MEARLCELDDSFSEEVALIEQRCFPERPWPLRIINDAFKSDSRVHFGITVDGMLAAYCFSFLESTELQIVNVAVDSSYRFSGYGKKLLRAVMNRSSTLGATKAVAEARVSNQAVHKVFLELGFEQHEILKGFYKSNGEDAAVFRIRFDTIPPFPDHPNHS